MVIYIIFLPLLIFTENFYEFLGLNTEASFYEITKSSDLILKENDPSQNPGNRECAKKYYRGKKVKAILLDWNKRQLYNQIGEDQLDILIEKGQTENPNIKGFTGDKYIEIPIKLKDLYLGAKKTQTISKKVICNKCHGTGAKDGKTIKCPNCGGKGVVYQEVNMGMMAFNLQQPCPYCQGKGIYYKEACPYCKGLKLTTKEIETEINIPKGFDQNKLIVKKYESDEHPDLKPGDIIIKLKLNPHSNFEKINNDLYMDIHLSLEESLIGFSRKITHLDGHAVYFTRNETTPAHSSYIIENEGMPFIINNKEQKGNLHVTCIVDLPIISYESINKLQSLISE